MSEKFTRTEPNAVVQGCAASGNQGERSNVGFAEPLHWVEIELVGEDDQPIGGEEFHLVLPDGAEVIGHLDVNGHARIGDLVTSGTCTLSFPGLDQHAWEFIETASARATAEQS